MSGQDVAPKGRIRRAVEVAATALLLGIAAAAVTHGEFHSGLVIIWGGLAGTFVLLTLGSICQYFRRTRVVAAFLLLLGKATILAIPVAFIAGRSVVAFDLWRAKTYVARQLRPRLESTRASLGKYPEELRLWEHPPPDAPWLIKQFNYSSDGNEYTLWVMDPGVCGRVTRYSSAKRQWIEKYDPCLY